MFLPGIDDQVLLSPVDLAVSLYLPDKPAERDTRMHFDRLRHLLEIADRALQARGIDKRQRAAIMDPAREALGHFDFETHRPRALALLADKSFARVFELSIMVREAAVVGRRFYIRPLLPIANAGPRFIVLALSANSIRLLDCDDYGWWNATPEHVQRLADVMAETIYEPTMQGNPASRHRAIAEGAAGSHSYESPDEVRKAELIEYLRRVSSAVEAVLKHHRHPVVLVADPEIAGHFRKITALPRLLARTVAVNPHGVAEETLVTSARGLRQSYERAAITDVVDRVNARLGRGENSVSVQVEEIVGAAHFARVDAVVVADDASVWGRFDEANWTATAHDARLADDDELLNEIAAETLLKGGRAFSAARMELPRQSPVVATLRY